MYVRGNFKKDNNNYNCSNVYIKSNLKKNNNDNNIAGKNNIKKEKFISHIIDQVIDN